LSRVPDARSGPLAPAISLAWPALRIDEGGTLRSSPRASLGGEAASGTAQTSTDTPPFCRRPLPVDPDDGGVDHLDIAVVSLCDRVHKPIPDAGLPPSVDPEGIVRSTVVDRRRRPMAGRHVRPWRARAQTPEDAVQHLPVIARSRASGKNLFVVLLMVAHPSQELSPPANRGRFNTTGRRPRNVVFPSIKSVLHDVAGEMLVLKSARGELIEPSSFWCRPARTPFSPAPAIFWSRGRQRPM